MTDLVFLHTLLASCPVITLLGPFFLLVAIVLVNDTFCSICGYSSEELIGGTQ